MTRGELILESLDLKEASSRVSSLDKNSPDYKKEYQKIVDEYLIKVVDAIKEEDIEVRVAILDMLFNLSPSFTCLILQRKVDSILRAQLVLELLKGVKPSDIKDNLSDAKSSINQSIIMHNSNITTINFSNEMLDILNKYLSKINSDDIDDMVYDDTIVFASKLDEVTSIMFGKNYYPGRRRIIYSLFSITYMDDKILNKLYNNIVIHMDDIDYDLIFDKDIEYLSRIKGIYKKSTDKVFDTLTSDIDEIDDLYDFFDEIIKTNIDDRDGLKWFFKEIGKRNHLLKDYYK